MRTKKKINWNIIVVFGNEDHLKGCHGAYDSIYHF